MLTENLKCAESLMLDLDTQRGRRLSYHHYAQLMRPALADTAAGEAKVGGNPTLVFESVWRDTRQGGASIVRIPIDGAGGCSIEYAVELGIWPVTPCSISRRLFGCVRRRRTSLNSRRQCRQNC